MVARIMNANNDKPSKMDSSTRGDPRLEFITFRVLLTNLFISYDDKST